MRTMTHSAMTLVACMALGCPGGDDTTARPPRSTATPPATAAQGTTPSERAPATPAVERAATPSAPVAMALEPAVDLVPVLGSVRVVALYDGEALPSASRQVGRFVSVVGRARDAHLVEPDAAERAAATAWLDAADRPIPAAWSRSEVVVLLRLAAPASTPANRQVTGGLRDMVVLKPGAQEANYRDQVEPSATRSYLPRPAFDGARSGAAVDSLLDSVTGGA